MDKTQLDYSLDKVVTEKEILLFEIDTYKYAVSKGYRDQDEELELDFQIKADAILELFDYLKEQQDLTVPK